jgi:hypothetical protein
MNGHFKQFSVPSFATASGFLLAVVDGVGGLGTIAFHGHQKITLSSGQEMMIRITSK